MDQIKINIHDLKKKNFHDVIWLPTGEYTFADNITSTNYIQLDKRKLKAPFHDLNKGFNCTLNYMNNTKTFNSYSIKSLDGKLLNVDHKYNRLSFVNESDKNIHNMSNVILISGSYMLKCKLINTKTTNLIDNNDTVLISIISIFEKDSSMNFCFGNYRELNISNKYKKFVSFSENFEVNISDDPTIFTIMNNIPEKLNDTLKYGEIILIPFKHHINHNIQGTIIPIILPFAKKI